MAALHRLNSSDLYPMFMQDHLCFFIYLLLTGETAIGRTKSICTKYDVGRPTSRASLRHFRPSEFWLGDLRLDGFVSVEMVGFMEGTLVTRPHHWNAAEVRVNVQSPTGDLKVQLQDETGRAFAGFGADDCESIVDDVLDAPVRWRGSSDVRSLSRKMVALQFSFLPEDKLYS